MTDVRAALRRALSVAIRERDAIACSALRSALGAIDNAEAVAVPEAPQATAGPIAKSSAGLGATEAPRRTLTEAELVAIVRREVADREAAAKTYEAIGQPEAASRLRAEAAVLRIHVGAA